MSFDIGVEGFLLRVGLFGIFIGLLPRGKNGKGFGSFFDMVTRFFPLVPISGVPGPAKKHVASGMSSTSNLVNLTTLEEFSK